MKLTVQSPRVSMVMPVYNGERYLRAAMDAVLSQTFTDFEFIIVDDGSTDGTTDILDKYHDSRIIRLHNKTNQGLAKSLNIGIELARGEFIARQDADDISLPNRLEQQVHLLERHPNVVIVGSDCYLINDEGVHVGVWRYPSTDTDIRWQALFHCSFVHTSVMLRVETLSRSNLRYDTNLVYVEDYDLWSRLLNYGEGKNIGQPLVKYRIHTGQVSTTAAEKQKSSSDRISLSILKGLGFKFTDEEVRKLRTFFLKFSQSKELDKQDIILCKTMLKILSAFANMDNIDPDIVRRIRRRWIGCILVTVYKHRLAILRNSGLFWAMIRSDATFLITRALKRVMSLLKQFVQLVQQS